ncbi:phage tail protein [Flavobacterium rhizosphaerae]|uniref:Tail fiber protein n=1 Tax=Flavobacterium rhizosphaerae TaxID=3163298 RepID=A0ABW8YZ11_9FLAO
MNDLYIATIIPWSSHRVPNGCLPCDGRLLPINNNEVLFSLIGNIYGGDGVTNFALPDLRQRTPMGRTTNHPLGYKDGQQYVTLTQAQMPMHNHTAAFSPNPAYQSTVVATAHAGTAGTSINTPEGNFWGAVPPVSLQQVNTYGPTNDTTMAADAIQVNISSNAGSVAINNSGLQQAHDNMPPFLVIKWLIVVQGLYPSRSN